MRIVVGILGEAYRACHVKTWSVLEKNANDRRFGGVYYSSGVKGVAVCSSHQSWKPTALDIGETLVAIYIDMTTLMILSRYSSYIW